MPILTTSALLLAAALPGQCNEYQRPNFTPAEVKCVIRRVFPDHLEDEAIAVANCESRLNPLVTNRSGAAGVFQFMPDTWRRKWNPYRRKSPYNVVVNVKAAKVLYHTRTYPGGPMYGWTPWSCSPY
jgi:hypothetical protein